ncbi:MAG: histidine kinase, partial [Anaerolineae bacterium]|nr:histidine kinase [Anaerolineae bacterium]
LTNMELPANVHAAEKAGVTMDVIHAFMESRGIPRMIATINESGRRVAAIVDNMLSFAPNAETSATTLDMEELLNKAVELASTDYDLKRQYDFKVIEIIKEYGENLPFVPCEESKMQQVFLNILRNGAQAMHGVRKQAGARPLRFILRLVHEKEAGVMRIEIEDNGPGMDESTSKRVFEPFFTTKPVDEGTGLGLSVSYFIITENQGGEMEVVSELGQGANFIIRLPLERKKI